MCESAIVVSSGLPMTLVSPPLPLSRFANSGLPSGWMKIRQPSSSAFFQNGWKLRIGQLLAVDAAADPGAAQPELLDRVFQLLGRQNPDYCSATVGEGDEAVRLRRAELGELLVLQA